VHPMGVLQSMLSSGAPREPRVEVDSLLIPTNSRVLYGFTPTGKYELPQGSAELCTPGW
jgi:hypothetical protein